MNLSERLGVAAKVRASTPPPLPVVELTTRDVHVDVTGPTAAVDLRTASDVPPEHTTEETLPARFSLRARLDRRAKAAEPEPPRRHRVDAPPCPRCGTPARIDINDRARGVLYVSCDECFTMWQAPVHAGRPSH